MANATAKQTTMVNSVSMVRVESLPQIQKGVRRKVWLKGDKETQKILHDNL